MDNDYRKDTLKSYDEILALKDKYGNKFGEYQYELMNWMWNMELDEWYSLINRARNEPGISLMIKVICNNILLFGSLADYWEFNDSYTAIRRSRIPLILTQKNRNNGSIINLSLRHS